MTGIIVLLVLLACLGAAVLIIGLVIFLFNKLVRLKNLCAQGWSDVDVQLQRRYDLIPNLVETVKGYAGHERETLEKVIQARQQAINVSADDVAAKAAAENMLTQTLRSLFALSESYPDLKANENFLNLQEQLSEIEDQIHLSRRYYNAVARDNNNAVMMFPSNIIAKMFHFSKAEYFELEEPEARKAPKVEF